MSVLKDKFIAQARELCAEASLIQVKWAISIGHFTKEKTSNYDNIAKQAEKIVDYRGSYQRWYSVASLLVKQAMPNRFVEFEVLYTGSAKTKLDISTYGIHHHFVGVRPIHLTEPSVHALGLFAVQTQIVDSIEKFLVSSIAHITSEIRFELSESELQTAQELVRNGHIRAGGAVAGVVLEGFLRDICINSNCIFTKKSPSIGDYNDKLRDSGIYDNSTWKKILYLSEIRNLSVHKKEREPTPDEVSELIREVDKIMKVVG